jgi:HK97 family phage prohead protease
MKMERRITSGGPRVSIEKRSDGGNRAVGYAAVYFRAGDPGTQYQLSDKIVERILPGAFDGVMSANDDARALFNHDPNHILGRLSAGTLRLSVDDVGLRYEIDLPDTQAGRDVATSIERGDLSGSSFGFKLAAGGARWAKDEVMDVRNIEKLGRLFDVGPVTYPAYQGTSAALRSEGDAKEAFHELEQLGYYTGLRKRFAVAAHARALDVSGQLG